MSKTVDKQHYSDASRLLGMNVTFLDNESGLLEASFEALPQFGNSIGNIQGGFLVAMLDDLMGYALGHTLPEDRFAPTANLNVSFIRPARAGTLHGRGQILKQEGDIYHLASKLYNADGELLASATAKAKAGNIN